jgi:coenzyme Q-binding protein COQ10
MPSFTSTRHVRHAATDMFDLVADVKAYPQFLPLCESLVVHSRTAVGEKSVGEKEVVIATMTVSYSLLRESFTSRVTLDRQKLIIMAEYLDGPFEHLENVWRFEPRGRGDCVVHFSIDYEFRSRTLAMLMGTVFDRAFRKFAEAFEARADQVYRAERTAS